MGACASQEPQRPLEIKHANPTIQKHVDREQSISKQPTLHKVPSASPRADELSTLARDEPTELMSISAANIPIDGPDRKMGANMAQTRNRLKVTIRATRVGEESMKATVQLPEDEDINVWFTVNMDVFYKALRNLYDKVAEQCNAQTCPRMTGGKNVEYSWKEGNSAPKRVPASVYINKTLDWADGQLSNAQIFPVEDMNFPKNFLDEVRMMMKKLFRIYVHLYYHHYKDMKKQRSTSELNASFRRFVYFAHTFDLLEVEEAKPLKPVIENFLPAMFQKKKKSKKSKKRGDDYDSADDTS